MKTSVCVLIAMAWSGVVSAQSASDEVQAKLNAITRMSAHFTQVITAGKREVANSSGEMALSRPGKFRWETKSPLEQLIVADGKKLWVYDRDLEQVTVKKQENSVGGTPGLFLSGTGNTVARDFTVAKRADASYELHAKYAKENYQRVVLRFKGELLAAIEFYDQLGQHTTVQLSHIKSNPQLAENMFQFKPPKGVDIVTQY